MSASLIVAHNNLFIDDRQLKSTYDASFKILIETFLEINFKNSFDDHLNHSIIELMSAIDEKTFIFKINEQMTKKFLNDRIL